MWQQSQPPFPWPFHQTAWPAVQPPPTRTSFDIGQLGDQVENRLEAAGKTPRSGEARNAAYRRVEAAVNGLGPTLFPLITAVEERISGTRPMPAISGPLGQLPRGDRYELTGRVDVISSVSLVSQQSNPIVQMIEATVQGLIGNFDVIVDYKAARRPVANPNGNQKHYWQHEAWQVQTYAWLRSQQPDAAPVRAGVLIYVNELSPSQTDMKELKREIVNGQTDVYPIHGSADYYALNSWQPGQQVPSLSWQFLMSRAVRIVSVTPTDIDAAVQGIDAEIGEIETRALNENATGVIPNNWAPTGEEQDCVACDFRLFCPSPASTRGTGRLPQPPSAPG